MKCPECNEPCLWNQYHQKGWHCWNKDCSKFKEKIRNITMTRIIHCKKHEAEIITVSEVTI